MGVLVRLMLTFTVILVLSWSVIKRVRLELGERSRAVQSATSDKHR